MKDYLIIFIDDNASKIYKADIISARNTDEAMSKGDDLYFELRSRQQIPICGFDLYNEDCSDWGNVKELYNKILQRKRA